jgi:hypothetical protein
MSNERKDCLRRAFSVGLAYAGRHEDVSWIPDGCSSEMLPEICERLGLVLIMLDGRYTFHMEPVLVGYDMEDGVVTNEDEPGFGQNICHAVFASDILPFIRWKIKFAVLGWNRINKE